MKKDFYDYLEETKNRDLSKFKSLKTLSKETREQIEGIITKNIHDTDHSVLEDGMVNLFKKVYGSNMRKINSELKELFAQDDIDWDSEFGDDLRDYIADALSIIIEGESVITPNVAFRVIMKNYIGK